MISVIILFNIDIGRAGYMKRELKMKKTIIEEFKDHRIFVKNNYYLK